MKKHLVSFFWLMAMLLVFALFFWHMGKLPSDLNDDVCRFANKEVKGVITGTGGHGIYEWMEVDNEKKSFMVSISEVSVNKGFSEYHYYEEGDSIIKEANSKKVTIKNGNKMLVFVLNCDD